MPHQAEDIWQNIVESQKGGLESILLSDWVKVNPRWDDAGLEEDFSKILKAREIVTKAIEPLRADKKVGSSLEVAVYVKASGEAMQVLNANGSELNNIFITSQAFICDEAPEGALTEYSEDEFAVWVAQAQGEKM